MMDYMAGIAMGSSVFLLLGFGGIALYYARKNQEKDSTEFFLTARNSASGQEIAWSFYSCTVGAWYCVFDLR